ncbi:ribosomal protein S18-alanine N-acetyltransferase [Alkalibacter mobilis]|uniref:ribosomal protein S18-alanine N-acetyltransferase n=1 Tax=Alkalibacter mobilis TaxID=2787712 RepID=UPI00189F0D18|nr:ribosomal protein S18-alanine N-acetyltransferase [Alkalibacter mobilis]MBF7096608.1 ribosomal protein S18-alanine N-acetyltransferase [Alkalibacter mobilis]
MTSKKVIEITRMKLHDLDEIILLENRSFTIPWTRNMFEEELKNPLARYFVLWVDSQIAGYGGIWLIFDEGHITNVAIHPNYRKIGLGKVLLEHMVDESKKEGVSEFTLEVRVGNTGALALYRSCGFEKAGIRKNYYSDNNEDAIIMWRKND